MKYVVTAVVAFAVIVMAAAWLWRSRAEKRPGASSIPFRMPIDDAFDLTAPDKIVVVGVVAQGEVRPGARLVMRFATDELPVTVEALEANHRPLQVARQGDRVGIMLVGARKEQVDAGTVLVSRAE